MAISIACDRCGNAFTPCQGYGGADRAFFARVRNPLDLSTVMNVTFDICPTCLSGAGSALLTAFSFSPEAAAAGIVPGAVLAPAGAGTGSGT